MLQLRLSYTWACKAGADRVGYGVAWTGVGGVHTCRILISFMIHIQSLRQIQCLFKIHSICALLKLYLIFVLFLFLQTGNYKLFSFFSSPSYTCDNFLSFLSIFLVREKRKLLRTCCAQFLFLLCFLQAFRHAHFSDCSLHYSSELLQSQRIQKTYIENM